MPCELWVWKKRRRRRKKKLYRELKLYHRQTNGWPENQEDRGRVSAVRRTKLDGETFCLPFRLHLWCLEEKRFQKDFTLPANGSAPLLSVGPTPRGTDMPAHTHTLHTHTHYPNLISHRLNFYCSSLVAGCPGWLHCKHVKTETPVCVCMCVCVCVRARVREREGAGWI